MKDFLAFRTMLTPVLIQAVFWIGLAISASVGLAFLLSGISAQYGGGRHAVWGILILLLGPLAVRIYCEILIIFFRINETLTEIRQILEERRSTEG